MSGDERLKNANAIIEVIASNGRKFFSLAAEGKQVAENRISRFELVNGRLWFIDKYTQKPIYTAYRRGQWHHFSDGGTLRNLIENLHDYIMHGAPVRNHFGPWPEWVCGGDLWGYGDAMQAVRQGVSSILTI